MPRQGSSSRVISPASRWQAFYRRGDGFGMPSASLPPMARSTMDRASWLASGFGLRFLAGLFLAGFFMQAD